MNKIVLYTCESGYSLFLEKKPFIATVEKNEGDYKVIAPVENLIEMPLEEELESYDVIDLTGVTVEMV